ncbi:hypothetical protein Tco_1352385 [Tanacetum coccineum]
MLDEGGSRLLCDHQHLATRHHAAATEAASHCRTLVQAAATVAAADCACMHGLNVRGVGVGCYPTSNQFGRYGAANDEGATRSEEDKCLFILLFGAFTESFQRVGIWACEGKITVVILVRDRCPRGKGNLPRYRSRSGTFRTWSMLVLVSECPHLTWKPTQIVRYAGANLDGNPHRRLSISWQEYLFMQCKKQTIMATYYYRGRIWFLYEVFSVQKNLDHSDEFSWSYLGFRESLERDIDGTEELLLPDLFILWLTKVSTDSAKLIPLGKDSTAIKTLEKIPPRV